MAQPARQYEPVTGIVAPHTPALTKTEKTEEEGTDIKIGKMIFYITCALGLWFFYWFNGIQCPC